MGDKLADVGGLLKNPLAQLMLQFGNMGEDTPATDPARDLHAFFYAPWMSAQHTGRVMIPGNCQHGIGNMVDSLAQLSQLATSSVGTKKNSQKRHVGPYRACRADATRTPGAPLFSSQ